jgi:uncharacterized protein with HEPN domain
LGRHGRGDARRHRTHRVVHGGLDKDAFVNDEKTVFAVCYAFVRLGQAVAQMPSAVTGAHPDVEWGDIRHFRNFMIHVYLSVDPARLYETAKGDLPALAAKLRAVLRGGSKGEM